MISYISETWGGRASDKQIVVESGFLNLLDPNDLVMADRGFPIKEELLLRRARLAIPPLHAINRLKLFKSLKETLPITLLPIIDDIINKIAALCNLLPPLVSYE
ncbi:hypothetical protein ACJMK2_012439 [Sinanodonta woodiana]|uniref:DDE Tnp4 domain-containing protein n=1 Tax=Sinanodonta woodiana TaxID=1069815 RepID=A0ABD3V868_SINWO